MARTDIKTGKEAEFHSGIDVNLESTNTNEMYTKMKGMVWYSRV